MKKTLTIVIVLIIIGALWYFVSPLFINKTVDEEFIQKVESMTEEEVASMSEEERAEMEIKMVEEYSKVPDSTMEESMPMEEEVSEPVIVLEGSFMDADNFHKASGSATIYSLSSEGEVLRFEDFSVTNGPDLRVLLATPEFVEGNGGEYIELEKLKGNKGNQNYDIPTGTNLDKYTEVVIYCKPFSVIFGSATLN